MTGGGAFGAAAIGLLFALITFALGWAASSTLPRPRARGDPDSGLMSDGAVLLIADGVVEQASPAALARLGPVMGQEIATLLEEAFGAEAEAAIRQVARLEERGDSFALLLRTGAGAVELRGAPAGAMIRLVIRDADHLDSLLRAAEARVDAAEAALHKGSFEHEALRAIISKGPILAWHRDVSGKIRWSAGNIETGAGTALPEQVVDMLATRSRLSQRTTVTGAGEVEKTRIEIVAGDSAETISVHVVEIIRQDGSRIGFGTDAGSATMAERRLARFVQTMTETFAHLTVGLAIFDRNQTLALFNPALVQMWGLEPSWLAHRPSLRDILDELRARRRLPEHEDFHRWREKLLALFENPETADYEELWHLADGSNIRVLARPHPHGALAFTFDDVTERMRLEQRYRHSIDLRRATLDGLSEGVIVFGPDGMVQFSNATFKRIWRMEERHEEATIHARQLIDHFETIAPAPETWQRLHGFITGDEGRHSWSARMGTSDGATLSARFAALPDGSTLGVFHDISGTERIAEDLQNHMAALEIAEDARRALHGMLGKAGRARGAGGRGRDRGRKPDVDQGGERSARRAADQQDSGTDETIAHLTRLLAGANRIAAQPLVPLAEVERSDPASILELVAAIKAGGAALRGVTIRADVANSPEHLSRPAGQLARIVSCLLDEAINRAADGAAIRLSAAGDDQGFTLGATISACLAASRPAGAQELDDLVRLDGGQVRRHKGGAGRPATLSCHFGDAAGENAGLEELRTDPARAER